MVVCELGAEGGTASQVMEEYMHVLWNESSTVWVCISCQKI